MGYRKFSKLEELLGVKCYLCETRVRGRANVENHHVDGNHHNNRRKNQSWICIKCHKKINKLQKTVRNKRLLAVDGGKRVRVNKTPANDSAGKYEMTESQERSDKIKYGLLRYLAEEAVNRGESREDILINAGPFIDIDNLPSRDALKRWLNVFTESRYFPYRFDAHDVIYMIKPELKEDDNKA